MAEPQLHRAAYSELSLTFAHFCLGKCGACDHPPVSTSPSSAVKQKDTDTTSGSGSPEAANCRKLGKYNVESITLAWPSPRIPPEQLLGVPASGRMLEQTGGGSGPGGSLTTLRASVSTALIAGFWWILLNEWKLQPKSKAGVAPAALMR